MAIGPYWNGPYDPALAVLTGTLIAIIWYVYLTFMVVTHEEPSRAIVQVGSDQGPRELNFMVHNISHERSLTVRLSIRIFRDGELLEIPEELRGEAGNQVEVLPRTQWERKIKVAPAKSVESSRLGPAVQMGEPEEFLIEYGAAWVDDLNNRATAGPYNYVVQTLSLEIKQLPTSTEVAARFNHLDERVSKDSSKKLCKAIR